MLRRPFGRTGVTVSSLGLGCMNLGDATPHDAALRIVDRALDAGIDLLDTADCYGNGAAETLLGEALQGGRRDRVFLATKAHFPTSADPKDRGNSRRHLVRACEASLRRLRTDRVDLLQVHRPDFATPQDETLAALDDLVRAGKVVYVGTSTHPAWFVMEGLAISERRGLCRYVSEQPPYNLLDRRIETELLPFAQRHGIAILPWSPLAMGMLAGRYATAGEPPPGSRVARLGGTSGIYGQRVTTTALERAALVADVARAAGLEPALLAMAWVHQRPGVTAVLCGPRTEDQLELALRATDVTLPVELLTALDAIQPPGTASADFLNNRGVGGPP
ncbi:MAG: aldo/keto reductase [Planctomycetes bacterium]|nr:aldo/keto reductase [Planctomycetota bacterium]